MLPSETMTQCRSHVFYDPESKSAFKIISKNGIEGLENVFLNTSTKT